MNAIGHAVAGAVVALGELRGDVGRHLVLAARSARSANRRRPSAPHEGSVDGSIGVSTGPLPPVHCVPPLPPEPAGAVGLAAVVLERRAVRIGSATAGRRESEDEDEAP